MLGKTLVWCQLCRGSSWQQCGISCKDGEALSSAFEKSMRLLVRPCPSYIGRALGCQMTFEDSLSPGPIWRLLPVMIQWLLKLFAKERIFKFSFPNEHIVKIKRRRLREIVHVMSLYQWYYSILSCTIKLVPRCASILWASKFKLLVENELITAAAMKPSLIIPPLTSSLLGKTWADRAQLIT